MFKINRSIVIDAPVERVYNFMDDPCNLPLFWPSMIEAHPTSLGANGGKNFDWEYKMVGLRVHGASEVTERIPNKRMVTASRKGIESTFTWDYTAEGDKTHLDLHVEYNIPIPLLGQLAEAVIRKSNEHEADVMLANMKALLEGK